jgi:hypothetical protein
MHITITNAQNTNESTPSTLSCVGFTPWGWEKHSFNAYKGLVPISPYTTPKAPIERYKKYLRFFLPEEFSAEGLFAISVLITGSFSSKSA